MCGKKVDEHRLVWERHYGPIGKGLVIHHKDNNKQNNDIDNLEIMLLCDHSRKHMLGRVVNTETIEKIVAANKSRSDKYYASLPEGHLICSKCAQLLPVSMFHKHKLHKSGHCTQCKSCRKGSRTDTKKI